MSKLNQIKCIILFLFISSILILPCNGSDTQFFNIPIHQFIITNVSQYEFYPGEINPINITIKNIRGNSVFEITSNITTFGPIKIKKELSKHRPGELYSNQECIFQYELFIEENAQKGVYYLPVTVYWSAVDDGVVQIQEDLTLGIEIVENPDDVIVDITDVIFPTEIKAGDNFPIEIELKNIGKKQIGSIKANFPLFHPFSSIGPDTEMFIPLLEPNETVKIRFDLQVDEQAVSKLYYFNFTLNYRDQINRLISKTNVIGINVEEESSVYIQDIILEPTLLMPETEGLLMIQLINAGTNPIENLKIIIYGGDELLAQTQNFVGQIGPGESKTTSFGIYVDPEVMTGKYGLNIYITYNTAGKDKAFSYIYFTNVIPSSSLIEIPEEVISIAIAFSAISVLTYIIFWMIGSRIAKFKDE